MAVTAAEFTTPRAGLLRAHRSGIETAVRRELPSRLRTADLSPWDEPALLEQARTLHRLRTECGCRAGEVGLLLMLVVAVLDAALVRHPHAAIGAAVAAFEIAAAVVIGGVVGKVAGIGVARTRYVVHARRIGAGVVGAVR